MKNTHKKYLLAVLMPALLLAEGCDNKLDIKPTSFVDVSVGSKEVELTLEGAYALLSSGNNNISNVDALYSGSLIMIPDLLVAEDYLIWTGSFNYFRDIVNKSMVNTNNGATTVWGRAYQCIGSANTVIANLANVSEDKREILEADARFIRGIMYFELVRLYAQQWVPGEANNQLGVPIVLTPTVAITGDLQVPRATVAQVYEQVLADLNFAKDKLPTENGHHANTYTASGFLSRVYLQQSDFGKSLIEANRVITEGPYQLEESVAALYNEGTASSKETIFSIQQTDQNNAGTSNFGLYAFYGCGGSSAGNGRGDINPDPAFYDLYQEGDERKAELFYEGTCTKSGNLTSGKWKDPYSDYVVMRLAEMYLNRAECNYRLGTAVGDTPVNDLNAIKARAKAPMLASINSVSEILAERRLELAFEGFGIHDIRRTQGKVGNLAWNDPRLVLPIPLRELNANSQLVQNPGY